MKYSIIIFLIVLLQLVYTSEALVHTKRTFNHTQWGDQTFYWEYLPPGYGNGTKFPVLLFFHGMGEAPFNTVNFTTLDRVPLNAGTPPYYISNNIWPLDLPFIVLSPQAPYGHGGGSVELAIRIVKEQYTTHADFYRIYVTGLSQGGGAVWQFISSSTTNGLNAAAVVPICGSVAPTAGSNQFATVVSSNIPIWTFHATNDATVNISQTTTAWVNGINALGHTPVPKYTIFATGGHSIWANAYETNRAVNTQNYIYDWLLSYSRAPGGSTTTTSVTTTGPATTATTASTTSTTGPASTTGTTTTGTTTTTTGGSTTGGSCPVGGGTPQVINYSGNCSCSCTCN
ncbi:hypothetical protein DLAC_09728 [Tieghemostelium lacteum]|uniref:Phospholipase/carboxylesterase/thioesterase domain-containing protein n=1 Tax=Tieghemostelium lacteum TaxID=361077 RepID=A0A151Z719_TIELA|nr:hypothetical protein DLAC_09728 [Tieghemostelium lacteum]|eukprot:KYQ89760.1 hypothetical protein DLAC_09728 [Tieghemostelium lacteum]